MRAFLALLCLLLTAAPSFAADKMRISVSIICNDHDAAGRLGAAFTRSFAKAPDYELVDTLPQAKLILNANRDINSRKNPEGWSIAIARVSNVQTYFAASKLADTQQADALAVKPVITGMVKEDGFLKSLNVAHLDDLSDANLEALAETVTAAFLTEISGGVKR
jgi:hypothetical protein